MMGNVIFWTILSFKRMNIETLLTNSLEKSKEVINESLNSREFLESLKKASELIIDTYNQKGKVMLAGNGGSAADSQHICAEFVGRFNFNRPSLPAIALIVYTTSGKSENILELIKVARPLVKSIIAMSGCEAQLLVDHCDVVISVNSDKTPKIQEVHAIAGHMICESVEFELFGDIKDTT